MSESMMAHNFTSSAVDELACPVCLLYYVPPYEPKNLPSCSHICCILCLKDLAKKEENKKELKCPQCNQVSKLPPTGVAGLPTILAMQNLAVKHPEGIKQQKERIQNDLRQHKIDKEKMLKEFTEQKKQLRDSVKNEIEAVEKSAEAVAKQVKELIEQIQATAQPNLAAQQERVLQVAEEIKGIDNICTKLQEMSDGEFLSQVEFLTTQMSKLQKAHAASNKPQVFKVAKFIPYEVRLGRVVRPRRLQLVRELQVDTFGKARNLAAMPNGLLVVCENAPNAQGHRPQQVIVIENKTGQYGMQAQFSVISSEIYKQIDVAVTADSKYLITKCTSGIDMYSPDGKFIKTINTQEEKPESKHVNTITTCVTTTFDGRIIAGSGTGKGEKSRVWFLSVHDLDGKILKTIPIGMMPLQIVNIRGTHVAVSGSKRAQEKICVYMYDLRSGQETIKIDIPIGLSIKFCYDIQSDCILTTRCTIDSRRSCDGSCVVEQYCTNTGKLVTTLAHGIAAPFGITLIHDGMLAVSYADTVNLYKIA